jgi:predicted small secreted protein
MTPRKANMNAVKTVVVVLVAGALAGIGALGCNTFKGVGRDIQGVGRGIQNAVEKAQRWNEHHRLKRITASAGVGGTINPSGLTSVPPGSSPTFTATANAGYRVADVLVDGRSVGAFPDLYHDNASSYTFYDITRHHTISASFEVNERR